MNTLALAGLRVGFQTDCLIRKETAKGEILPAAVRAALKFFPFAKQASTRRILPQARFGLRRRIGEFPRMGPQIVSR